MRKVIDVLSILGLIAAPVAIGSVYTQTYASPSSLTKAASASEKFPLNQPKRVNFQTDTEGFKRLTERQQMDQLRDWLLFTVLSSQGLSAKEINQSTYDLPTVRYGYMQPVANFEYGQTRSLYVGEGKVIALVPKGTSKEQRMDDLAHIADRHRKDIGKQPTSIAVFEYEIQLDKQSALLTRQEILNSNKIFSHEYGYKEALIKNLEDLQRFIEEVDDITIVEAKGNALNLGGRKIAVQKHEKINLEDIAAIWQLGSNNQNGGIGFSLDPKYDYISLQKQLVQSEFSLKSLFANDQKFVSDEDIESIKQEISKKDIRSYLKLVDKIVDKLKVAGDLKLTNGNREDIKNFLDAPISTSFQAARYDGELQGTEVGMILFYTDLLMKIWDFNFQNSTIETGIEGFTPETQIKISSIYQQEIKENPYARLWFSPNDSGFQISDQGNKILFAQNATRISAKSSNKQQAGKEEEIVADASVSHFLSWWNEHYKEVARYEPKYERLNQIMKWSLIVSWLNETNKSSLLSFLKTVPVKRDYWFPDWLKMQGHNLTFQGWDEKQCATDQLILEYSKRICFFEKGFKGYQTEIMPLLQSEVFDRFKEKRTFSGGVSLGSRDLIRKRSTLPKNSDVSELSLRSTLEYDSAWSKQNQLGFTNVDETSYKLENLNEETSSVIAKAKNDTVLRSPNAEMANQNFSSNILLTNKGVEINTAIGGSDFGTFSVSETRNGFVTGFHGRDMDNAHSLFSNLSTHSDVIKDIRNLPNALINETPDIQKILASQTDPSIYFVKKFDSKRWIQIVDDSTTASGGGGSKPPTPPSNWDMRVGGMDDNSRNFRLAFLDDDAIQKRIDLGELQSVYAAAPEETLVDEHGFAGVWDTGKHKQTAQKVIDNPSSFVQFKKARLKQELKKIDRWLADPKGTKTNIAIQKLDQLIQKYGPNPNLVLRKALAKIHQGKFRVEQISPNNLSARATSNQKFLDEIALLLKRKTQLIETDGAFYFVHDDPNLNNLSWGGSTEPVISRAGVRQYRLLPGDIGATKLNMVGLGDTAASAHNSTQGVGNNLLKYRPPIQNNECKPDGQAENPQCPVEEEKPVYIITASSS